MNQSSSNRPLHKPILHNQNNECVQNKGFQWAACLNGRREGIHRDRRVQRFHGMEPQRRDVQGVTGLEHNDPRPLPASSDKGRRERRSRRRRRSSRFCAAMLVGRVVLARSSHDDVSWQVAGAGAQVTHEFRELFLERGRSLVGVPPGAILQESREVRRQAGPSAVTETVVAVAAFLPHRPCLSTVATSIPLPTIARRRTRTRTAPAR